MVRAIPPGQVRSYGEVAAEAGLRSARLVGRMLAVDGHDLPWHRVVRADGSFAPHIAAEQAARLRVEGVLATDGRVPPALRPAPLTLPPRSRESTTHGAAKHATRHTRPCAGLGCCAVPGGSTRGVRDGCFACQAGRLAGQAAAPTARAAAV